MRKHVLLSAWLSMATGIAPFGAVAGELSEKQVFDATVGQVDTGGSYLSFINEQQLGDGVNRMFDSLEKAVIGSENGESRKAAEEIFGAIRIVVNSLNLQALQGMATSSRTEGNLSVTKTFTLFDQANPTGVAYGLSSWRNQPFAMRRMITPDTQFAVGGFLTPGKFWGQLSVVLQKSGNPKLVSFAELAEQQSSLQLGMPLATLLDSVSGEYFMMLTAVPGKDEMEIRGMAVLPDGNGKLRELIDAKLGTVLQKSASGGYLLPGLMPQAWIKPEIIFAEKQVIIVSDRAILAQAEKGGAATDPKLADYFRDMPENGISYFYLNPSRQLIDSLLAMSDDTESFSQMLASIKLPVAFGISFSANNGMAGICRSNYSVGELQTTLPMTIYGGILLPALNQAREKARCISCSSNEKQISLGLAMYAVDHDNAFPAENGVAGLQQLVENKYLVEPTVYVCPASSLNPEGDALTAQNCSYIYVGGFSPKDATVPVLFEQPGSHSNGNCNVGFADGHVEQVHIGDDDPAAVAAYLIKRGKLSDEASSKLLAALKEQGFDAAAEVGE